MDDARLRDMRETVLAMTRLNRDIWDFLGVLPKHLGKPR
jgi:hypothetical protein